MTISRRKDVFNGSTSAIIASTSRASSAASTPAGPLISGLENYRVPRLARVASEEHRFINFIDVEDGRGKVLYLRHDDDYGLVEPG